MDIALLILLLVFGVLLLVVELFMLPGFGVAGIAGFLSLAGAVAVAYIRLNVVYPWAGHATLAAALLLTSLAVYGFVKSKAIERMALETKIESNVELADPGKKLQNLKEDQK